jgi:2-keto-4-pentenoate hydratase
MADLLHTAECRREPITPLIKSHPGLTVAEAYWIQLHNIRRRASLTLGYKVGLSSLEIQRMVGADQPDYGHLLADMRLDEGMPIEAGRYCHPRVEMEVAFILGSDLSGEDCTEAEVLAATEAIAPAIELVDSRIRDWKISLADTVADNASSAGFVLGAARVAPGSLDLKTIEGTLWRNTQQVAHGRSDAVLGNPAAAVAWLARAVAGFGVRLCAGQVVLSGACARAVDVLPGDEFRAEFAGLGEMSLSFR